MFIDEERQHELNQLFSTFKICMPLGNWRVNLTFLSSTDISLISNLSNPYACTIINDNLLQANIYMNTEKEYLPWDNPTATLIHELIHVLQRHYDMYVESLIDKEVDTTLLNTLNEQFINVVSEGIYNIMNTE